MQTAEKMPLVVQLIYDTQNVLLTNKAPLKISCCFIMTSEHGGKNRAVSSKFATATLFEKIPIWSFWEGPQWPGRSNAPDYQWKLHFYLRDTAEEPLKPGGRQN